MTYNEDKGKQTKFLSPSSIMDGSSKVGNIIFPRVPLLEKGIRCLRAEGGAGKDSGTFLATEESTSVANGESWLAR